MEESSKEFLITTSDNPYDPFTQFDEWYLCDTELGYNTWQKIDKLMPSNYLVLSVNERNELINKAMERLIELLPFTYLKVFSSSDEETEAKELKNSNKNKLIKLSEVSKKSL